MDDSNTRPKYAAVKTSDVEIKDNPATMSRRYSDIVTSALITTIPILILSGVLLALVFNLSVVQGPSIFSQDQQDTLDEAGVYYVNISSTYLVFIASWSSSVVPMLATFLLTLASLLVIFADTWLHIATKTVTFTQLLEANDSPASYGFGLKEPCTLTNNSYESSTSGGACSLNPAATNTFLMNGTQSLQILNNVSSLATVSTIISGQEYAYLAVPPSEKLADEDWRAESFALQTQCRLASEECNMEATHGTNTPFKSFFTDSIMSDNSTYLGVENPFYFGMAALVNPSIGNYRVPDTVVPVHGGTAFVLLCNTTVLDVTYDSINGTISNFSGVLSNVSTANIWQSVMSSTSVGDYNLKQAASLAAMGDSSQKFADDMALAFSKTALAVGAQAVEKRPPLAVQLRFSFLVARVPAAPLYTLIGANMLVVFAGVMLTIIALVTSKGKVKEVQSRLSIVGLVADRFEGKTARLAAKDLDELFRESKGQETSRVGIDSAAEGGFEYKTWNEERLRDIVP
ncbi:unnamed protein product [Aureobasidium mustum]|uniref:Transmembrane protein n=1 Tax=Aureobasidium mustum TaxID=2773714 RepID=A0A9N8PCX7_9PEZI|nr:unnamed protein product [Aureobasidium mustum]